MIRPRRANVSSPLGRLRLLVFSIFLLAACNAAPVATTTTPEATTTTAPLPAGEWATRAPMTIARSEHPAVVLKGEMIVIGGLYEQAIGRNGTTEQVEAYDPATDTWRRLPDLPALRHHGMAAVVDDRMFFFGGYSGTSFNSANSVWELTDAGWEARRPLRVPTGAGAAAVIDGYIYIVGGTPASALYRYDPAEDSWTPLGDTPTDREHVAAVAYEDELWVIGGRWTDGAYATVDIYDPANDTWREGPTMNDARSGFGAAVLDGHIYVFGGEILETFRVVPTVERYNPDSGDWEYIANPPVALHGNPLVVIEGVLYVPGGAVRAAAVDNDPTLFVFRP